MERTISGMMGKGSVNHNTRAFSAKNVDKERSRDNVEFCHEDIKAVYHELFDEALERYNAKQKRSDRKIENYYEKIRQGKQEKLFYEVIFQIGNRDDMNARSEDYGISGYYELIRENEAESREKELENTIDERSQYYRASAYYLEIVDYWENVREARDVSNVNEPLFATNKQYYTKENFENEPKLVIHLAKNEIYARHGYIFKNEDLYNYFMGCVWYNPTCKAEDFDDSVLNEYEKANLEILASMDTY